MKKLFYFAIVSVFLNVAVQAQALPTLFFDGNAEYSPLGELLEINGVLTGDQDLSSNPTLPGSSLVFSALLMSSSSDSFITTGIFGTAPGDPDLSIIGGDGDILLEGEVSQFVMEGLNGWDFGSLTGQFYLTGGSLLSDFSSPSDVISLVLNLNTIFNQNMFDSNFHGQIDGQISSTTPVPEPATWILFSLCIPAVIGMRNKNTVRLMNG